LTKNPNPEDEMFRIDQSAQVFFEGYILNAGLYFFDFEIANKGIDARVFSIFLDNTHAINAML